MVFTYWFDSESGSLQDVVYNIVFFPAYILGYGVRRQRLFGCHAGEARTFLEYEERVTNFLWNLKREHGSFSEFERGGQRGTIFEMEVRHFSALGE